MLERTSNVRGSLLAGVLISIGSMFSMSVSGQGALVQGLCFSVGLFGILCCKASLFTGRVLEIRSVWNGSNSPSSVTRLLLGVWLLNLIATALVATMALSMGFDASAVVGAKLSLGPLQLMVRAIFCNVLVCLAVFIGGSDSGAPHKFLSCLMPVACFVSCGFEHSVANMFYMALGVLGGSCSMVDFAYVVGVSTIGNVIGGVAFAWLTEKTS